MKRLLLLATLVLCGCKIELTPFEKFGIAAHDHCLSVGGDGIQTLDLQGTSTYRCIYATPTVLETKAVYVFKDDKDPPIEIRLTE